MASPYAFSTGAAAEAAARAYMRPDTPLPHATGPTGAGMKIEECLPLPFHAQGWVYLSGPILGFTYEEARHGWRQYVQENVASGIRVLSPMRHEGHMSEHVGPLDDAAFDMADSFFTGDKFIVAKDLLDIRRCDVVLVNFLNVGPGGRPSLGTVSEMGMAYALNKPIVTVMEADNIHRHPFVTETSAVVLDNLDDAIFAINGLLSTGI